MRRDFNSAFTVVSESQFHYKLGSVIGNARILAFRLPDRVNQNGVRIQSVFIFQQILGSERQFLESKCAIFFVPGHIHCFGFVISDLPGQDKLEFTFLQNLVAAFKLQNTRHRITAAGTVDILKNLTGSLSVENPSAPGFRTGIAFLLIVRLGFLNLIPVSGRQVTDDQSFARLKDYRCFPILAKHRRLAFPVREELAADRNTVCILYANLKLKLPGLVRCPCHDQTYTQIPGVDQIIDSFFFRGFPGFHCNRVRCILSADFYHTVGSIRLLHGINAGNKIVQCRTCCFPILNRDGDLLFIVVLTAHNERVISISKRGFRLGIVHFDRLSQLYAATTGPVPNRKRAHIAAVNDTLVGTGFDRHPVLHVLQFITGIFESFLFGIQNFLYRELCALGETFECPARTSFQFNGRLAAFIELYVTDSAGQGFPVFIRERDSEYVSS